MKKHVKLYLKILKYYPGEYIPCETCFKPSVDIHHIEARGMGGSNSKDTINNLMALCRECHSKYGDKAQYKEYLKKTHEKRLHEMGIST